MTVNRSYMRQGSVAIYATLEQEDRHQLLEVPSWMFDLATCATMPLVDHPYVGIKHLQALKELLKSAAEGTDADVIETQHLDLSRKGDADEKKEKTDQRQLKLFQRQLKLFSMTIETPVL